MNLTSPDGLVTAVIESASEFGQGSPTIGRLELSNGLTFEKCNPSAVWSDDSKFLAIPQWRRVQRQRILAVSIERESFGYTPEIFSLLELHSFNGGRIKGIDSPIYHPREIEVELSGLRWNDEPATFWQRVRDIIGLT